MKLSTHNFLTQIKNIIVGGESAVPGAVAGDSGFLKDGPSVIPDPTSAAGGTTIRGDVFTVPRDYDEAADNLVLIFQGRSSGATDTPTIDVTVVRTRVGEADVDLLNNASLLTVTQNQQSVELDLSGNTFKRGDVLEFEFETTAHTTDNIEKLSAVVAYRSCLVSYDRFVNNDDSQPLR